MDGKVRRFVKGRMAQEGAAKKQQFGVAALSLGQIEEMFVAKLTEKCKLTERDISRVFKRFDKDNSGTIEKDEMVVFIKQLLGGN